MKPNEKVVTLILPKDKAILQKKYAQVMADIVTERLTKEQLDLLATELEKGTFDEQLNRMQFFKKGDEYHGIF